ncbi:malonate--CoA ligase [Neptunomonas antarctica]|uniref:Malonyl-CoA/methylmalonyl-CoA synthetase n=1 Tax=Neptunomonas antarctica TaxID=619304 RepID=A0A1N7N6D1_9GAMM|nr:malonyl-CoA synthase [Neptunomonas antarctica]SIS93963.1 malonyl-CoA/methylmalonyl-CoA synthetase [Neptunomonas antarctica]
MNDQNIYKLFQSKFPADTDAVFLEHEHGALLYSQIEERTGHLVWLLAQLGVGKGDRVIMQVDKSPEAVLLYLACLRFGAIFIPLNTAYTAQEVSYFMDDAKPHLMVCRPQEAESVNAEALKLGVPHVMTLDGIGGGTLMEALKEATYSDFIEECNGEDLACILYTSGTTGRSKGAMLSHDNLSSNAKVLHEYWQWEKGDVLLHALPIFHVHGLFVALHCALLNGSKIIFLSKFTQEAIKENIPNATVMMGVPTFYVRLLDDPDFNRDLCKNMRLFVAGSAPLLSETFDAFERVSGHKILERYGMTEAGMITSNPYDGERIPGTVGYPLPGVTARVADEAGKEVARGEVGVLEIQGPNIFQGYWCMPEKTAEEFRDDGFFITGDMAIMDEDNRISIVGRAKDLVISGGYNVYPKEVESVIDELEGVKESAVIGVAHPDFGEGVTAVIVRDGTAEVTDKSVIQYLKGKIARFKQPQKIFFVDELPRNAMGKVQKKQLREAYSDIYTH